MRYMDDVLGVMAVASDEDEARARWWFNTVKRGYPAPLQLNVEPESRETEFLELVILHDGPQISCMLYGKFIHAIRSKKLFITKLPDWQSGTDRVTRQGLVTGFVNRTLQGCSSVVEMLVALLSFQSELVAAGWSLGLMQVAIDSLVSKEEDFGEKEREMILELGVLML